MMYRRGTARLTSAFVGAERGPSFPTGHCRDDIRSVKNPGPAMIESCGARSNRAITWAKRTDRRRGRSIRRSRARGEADSIAAFRTSPADPWRGTAESLRQATRAVLCDARRHGADARIEALAFRRPGTTGTRQHSMKRRRTCVGATSRRNRHHAAILACLLTQIRDRDLAKGIVMAVTTTEL